MQNFFLASPHLKQIMLLIVISLIAISVHAQTAKYSVHQKDSLALIKKAKYYNQTFVYMNLEMNYRSLSMNEKEFYSMFSIPSDTNKGFGISNSIGIWKSINHFCFNIGYSISNESIEYHFNDPLYPSGAITYHFNQDISIHTIGSKVGYRVYIKPTPGMVFSFKKLKYVAKEKYTAASSYFLFTLGLNASSINATYKDINTGNYDINTGQLSLYPISTKSDYRLSYSLNAGIYYQTNYKNFSYIQGFEINRFSLPLLKDDLNYVTPKLLQIAFHLGIGFSL